MKEFLLEPLFTIDDAKVAPVNFLLIALIALCTFVILTLIKKYFGNTLSSQNIVAGGKERNLYKLVRQIIYFIAFIVAFESFAFNNDQLGVNTLLDYKFVLLDKPFKVHISLGIILFNIILFFIARFLFQLSRVLIKNYASDKKWISTHNQYTFITLSKYIIYTLALIIAVQSFGVNIGSVLIASAALLVGIGLGLQNFFTDIVSGIVLLVEGTIKVNDIVEVEGMVARVEKISIRSSIVKTREGKIIHIPNKKLTTENVVNWTSSDQNTRFSVFVRVAFGSNIEQVKDILYQCTMKHPRVNKHHNVNVLMVAFGESGLEFEIYFWAERNWEIELVKSDIRYAIEEEFRNKGIIIPFPQRDLHVKSGKL